jgi:hypothetical protein
MVPSLVNNCNGQSRPVEEVPIMKEFLDAPDTYNIPFQEQPFQPLAIVGFSLRFPQDATSPETFWKMLVEARCAMTEFPSDRLAIDSFYHPDTTRTDSVSNSILLLLFSVYILA